MPEYALQIICPHCKAFHDAFLHVSLDETFDILRVTDVYEGDIPAEFYQATAKLRCFALNRSIDPVESKMMVLTQVEN
jgi:hypothetical protein